MKCVLASTKENMQDSMFSTVIQIQVLVFGNPPSGNPVNQGLSYSIPCPFCQGAEIWTWSPTSYSSNTISRQRPLGGSTGTLAYWPRSQPELLHVMTILLSCNFHDYGLKLLTISSYDLWCDW